MAIMSLQENMVFWEVKVAGEAGMSEVLSHAISGFKISYEINMPAVATINILSESYVENVFTIYQKIEISMGFDRTNLIPMFSGTIKVLPKGNASNTLNYSVEAVGDESGLSIIAKNAIHSKMTKKQIIEILCKKNGVKSEVYIKDVAPLTAQSVPVQANKTDFQFLKECAAKWGCDFWFSKHDDGLYCFFFDQDLAYNEGNFRQKPNPNDFKKSDYILGYRTDSTRNNVAKVAWKFRAPKGGGDGTPSYTGSDEKGKQEVDRQYTINYRGERWQVKKTEYLKPALAKKSLWWKYVSESLENGFASGTAVTIHKYFEKCTVVSKEHSYKHQTSSINIIVDLNIGDPWLRPPRTVKLYHGSEDPRASSSHLPLFLWGNKYDSSFLLQKVTTALTAGKISTKLEMKKA